MRIKDLIPWSRKGNGRKRHRPLEERRGLMESMNRALGPSLFGGLSGFAPDVDIEETPKSVLVSASLPGVDKKDIRVDVTKDILTIRGERKMEREYEGEGGYCCREQAYGAFSRSVSLPASVHSDDVKAHYENGVLKIELPKVEETPAHRIEID